MRKKLTSLTLLGLLALAALAPAAPAAAEEVGVCVSSGEGWEEVKVCEEWDGGICHEIWASSGPRQFPIWDTCP